MSECEAGHIFHNRCAEKYPCDKPCDKVEEVLKKEGEEDEEEDEYDEEDGYDDEIPVARCPICQLKVLTNDMRVEFTKRTISDEQILEVLRKERDEKNAKDTKETKETK